MKYGYYGNLVTMVTALHCPLTFPDGTCFMEHAGIGKRKGLVAQGGAKRKNFGQKESDCNVSCCKIETFTF